MGIGDWGFGVGGLGGWGQTQNPHNKTTTPNPTRPRGI